MNKKLGKFIVIEGVGGSGKSTQMQKIKLLLKKNNIPVVITREPGGIHAAERIRDMIFDLRDKRLIGPEGQMALFFAARKLWLEKLVIPSLLKGINVLTDRSHTSTGAYQGYAEGGNMKQILGMADVVMGKYKPNAVILLDISPDCSIERKQDKAGDPYDKEGKKYLEKLIGGYRKMAKTGWGSLKWYKVDGEGTIDEVAGKIRQVLEKIFKKKLYE